MDAHRQLEAILFYSSEPLTIKKISSLLSLSVDDVITASEQLSKQLQERGLELVRTDDTLELRTHRDLAPVIEKLRKDELSRDIGKAGLETIAILLYRGACTRSEIDYIRGVNSSFILRHLLLRGLVTREQHETDQRTFKYRITTETLAHLGISEVTDLPDYEGVVGKLTSILDTNEEESDNTENS